jgi:(R)-2-hydroxyacyl-CoA dehydratese activating ATPase
MLSCGLDIGALWTKGAVLEDGALRGLAISLTGGDTRQAAESTLQQALVAAGLDVSPTLAVTGAGKNELPLPAERVTEVLCAARGARLCSESVRCVIDLGGESTRVMRLDDRGDVVDFTLNDKCAAGTGVFLDAMARVMGVSVERMGPLSLESTADVAITSMCVAFAESEVVSLVHRQTPRQDILRGIHRSIASRVFGMVRRVEPGGETMLIGGLALNVGIVAALEELMKRRLAIPANPQIVSALGAAAIAAGIRS